MAVLFHIIYDYTTGTELAVYVKSVIKCRQKVLRPLYLIAIKNVLGTQQRSRRNWKMQYEL